MAAPIGNEFWRKRTKHGRDKIFTLPKILLTVFREYLVYTDKRTINRPEMIKSGPMAGRVVQVPYPVPYTIQGLTTYMNVNVQYFSEFEESIKKTLEESKDKKKRELAQDFSIVIRAIRQHIYQQKFEGAAVGSFEKLIMARDLGLVEKREEGFRDKDGKPTDPPAQAIINVTNLLPDLAKKV